MGTNSELQKSDPGLGQGSGSPGACARRKVGTLKAEPVMIDWNPGLSIYASEEFLKAVGDEYGWLGGRDESGALRCVLPYTVVCKTMVRMVRFRVQTIPVGPELTVDEEKSFLNGALKCFRSLGADVVIPPATNTIFRSYPDKAQAAPYGSHVIDLTPSEDVLWANMHSKHRNVIRNATNKGVQVCTGLEYTEKAYELIRDTFKRSAMSFMDRNAFQRMVSSLGEYVKVFVAVSQGEIHGCAVIPFSRHCAYYAYGGSCAHPLSGATNLLQWEAIRAFRALGVQQYDFCGVRINPEKGSKAAGLEMYKERFGGKLIQGYMWKASLRPLKAAVYSLGVRVIRGGDIVDRERHKLAAFEEERRGLCNVVDRPGA